MVGRIAASFALAAVAALALAPGPAAACQVAGWTDDMLARLPKVIVEAEVTRELPGPGWELRVIRAVRGASAGERLTLGTRPHPPSDCFGRLPLEAGEHIVIAAQRPGSAALEEVVIWWVGSDGSITGWTGMYFEREWSTLDELWASLRALPETATEAAVAPTATPLPAWLKVVFAVGLIFGWRRLAARPLGRN